MDYQDTPNVSDCYRLHGELRSTGKATTTDGWALSFRGDKLNPRTQSIVATKDEQTIELKGYWSSEGIARLMTKARNDNNTSTPPTPN